MPGLTPAQADAILGYFNVLSDVCHTINDKTKESGTIPSDASWLKQEAKKDKGPEQATTIGQPGSSPSISTPDITGTV